MTTEVTILLVHRSVNEYVPARAVRGLRRRGRAETTDRQEAMSEARAGCLARDPRRRLAHILTVAWATRELRLDEDLARDKILVWAAWRRDG